jgi:hypothetical protein
MNRRLLIGMIALLLLLPHVAQAQGSAGDLLGRINNLRGSLGLPGYSINGALNAAAQSQAQWMAESASISHVRPDGSGPRTRAVNAGYPTTDVSENIYGGTNANVDTAWSFWVNSGIHYRGLTEPRFQEVGIGIATSSWGSTFVLVFGNPGGPAPFVPPPAGSSGGGGASAPPSYVRGVDEHGFIMHEIQQEDTLGDIALLYGYTWDDIPYMMQVNEIGDNRSLQIGEIFLVPPHDGTYTPTPGDASSATTPGPESESGEAEATATPQPTDIPTFTPLPTMAGIATAAAMPEVIAVALAQPPSATPLEVADAAAVTTDVVPMLAGGTITRSGPSPWLAIALVVQVGLLLLAGFEFVRRSRRK